MPAPPVRLTLLLDPDLARRLAARARAEARPRGNLARLLVAEGLAYRALAEAIVAVSPRERVQDAAGIATPPREHADDA